MSRRTAVWAIPVIWRSSWRRKCQIDEFGFLPVNWGHWSRRFVGSTRRLRFWRNPWEETGGPMGLVDAGSSGLYPVVDVAGRRPTLLTDFIGAATITVIVEGEARP